MSQYIKEEKIKYNQLAAIKSIRRSLSASKKHSSAIRGYNTYTRGYEIDNQYDVSFISLHNVKEEAIQIIRDNFEEDNINASVDHNGIDLKPLF